MSRWRKFEGFALSREAAFEGERGARGGRREEDGSVVEEVDVRSERVGRAGVRKGIFARRGQKKGRR